MMKARGNRMASSSAANDVGAGASETASADITVPLARDRMVVMAIRDRLDMGKRTRLRGRADSAPAAYRSGTAVRTAGCCVTPATGPASGGRARAHAGDEPAVAATREAIPFPCAAFARGSGTLVAVNAG